VLARLDEWLGPTCPDHRDVRRAPAIFIVSTAWVTLRLARLQERGWR
jgi:hypothetical protein